MNNNYHQDEIILKTTKKRASFKWSFSVYFFVNILLISAWYFSSEPGSYFWPGWIMLWWSIGLLFQYLSAYQDNNMFTVKQEYEMFKNQQDKQL